MIVHIISYSRVFVFINCIYSTAKLVKCCIYLCYVQTKKLITYLLTYPVLT